MATLPKNVVEEALTFPAVKAHTASDTLGKVTRAPMMAARENVCVKVALSDKNCLALFMLTASTARLMNSTVHVEVHMATALDFSLQ